MSVIPIRAEGRTKAAVKAYSPRGSILIASTNQLLVDGIRSALPNLLVFSNGRDVVDTIVNEGGYRALFVDFVPLEDQMTGMGLMRALRENGVVDLPIWLMADSWPEAQDVWAKEKLGARGYCPRNAGGILRCLGKKAGNQVDESVLPPIAEGDINETDRDALGKAFRLFAGPAAAYHLSEVLGNSDIRGAATSMDTAIQLLAERLMIPSRRKSFLETAADLKKKIALGESDQLRHEGVTELWLAEVKKTLRDFVGGLGAVHIMDAAKLSADQSGLIGRGVFIAELMTHITNVQRREQFRQELIKRGLLNTS